MGLLGGSLYFDIEHLEAENAKQLISPLFPRSNIAALFCGIHTRTVKCLAFIMDLIWSESPMEFIDQVNSRLNVPVM